MRKGWAILVFLWAMQCPKLMQHGENKIIKSTKVAFVFSSMFEAKPGLLEPLLEIAMPFLCLW